MKITINNYGKTYSVESDEDVDAESLADMFKGLMVSIGFHPKNVDQLFNTEFEWFPEEELKTNFDQKKVNEGVQALNQSNSSKSPKTKRYTGIG